MLEIAYLVVNTITIGTFAALFRCVPAGRALDCKLVEAPPPPVIFIASRPKAALLFWFFGDFRCGALLIMVIHVIYKYKNR